MEKPSKDKVLKKLAKYHSTGKSINRLALQVNGQLHLSIEGVFCQVASELGYPGRFAPFCPKHLTGAPPGEYFNYTYAGKNYFSFNMMPMGTTHFLGLVNYVDLSFLYSLGEKYKSKLHPIQGHISWKCLNERDNLSLSDLIGIAEKMLELNFVEERYWAQKK